MKLIFVLAAAVVISSLTEIAPANAQKDPACIEKCNRDNKVAGGVGRREVLARLSAHVSQLARLPRRRKEVSRWSLLVLE